VNAEEIEFTLRQAMRTAAFWIMILATPRAATCLMRSPFISADHGLERRQREACGGAGGDNGADEFAVAFADRLDRRSCQHAAADGGVHGRGRGCRLRSWATVKENGRSGYSFYCLQL
jgi:hypothetical protein